MRLIDQHAKRIMEECKVRAGEAGLQIHSDTLEYIVSNCDLIELGPKDMIPTLYDYWMHDVEVIRDKWIYDVYPRNPFETVVNTRPAISFYNDNNADWLNAMIFYHVLGHIDFFQNNIFFRKTWDDDFCGQALADKRLINHLREERGEEKRWVDYVIEFVLAIDNLVGYYQELEEENQAQVREVFGAMSEKASFYFGEFLRALYDQRKIQMRFYYDEIDRYNHVVTQFGQERGEEIFFGSPELRGKFPEFNSAFKKSKKKTVVQSRDILQHLIENSEFINKERNRWMKDVLGVIRKTSLFFQPQIRSKICNEGWACLWHERLFITDPRIEGHRIDFAKINSDVSLVPRIGFNPYAVGKYLFEFIEEMAAKGKLSSAFQSITNAQEREDYNHPIRQDQGKRALFEARRNFNDSLLVNFLSDEDFQDFVSKYNLFVVGVRPSHERRGFVEYYIKSRKGEDYRAMLNRQLYHPPYIVISEEKAKDGELYLDHIYENRTLVTKYIAPVLIGLAYLAGTRVKLETTEFVKEDADEEAPKFRVLYACQGKDVTKTVLGKV